MAEEITSPLKAIKMYCYECSGSSFYEVKRCASDTCPLKPFRFGTNPFHKINLTDEQRRERAERMKAMRANKVNEERTK